MKLRIGTPPSIQGASTHFTAVRKQIDYPMLEESQLHRTLQTL